MAPQADTVIRWRRIVGVVLLLGLLAEGASQLVVFLWVGERYRTFAPYVWSPYGVVRNNPRLTSPQFKIDASGFRALRDYSREKPKRTLRVMMLGGSVLYSGLGGVPQEGVERVGSDQTMAQHLERYLRSDAGLRGIDVEVINAAVNFNRIVEVGVAYIAEYAFWHPDVVIICGSFNNFGRIVAPGEVAARRVGLQAAHPWRLEFERVVNRRSFMSLIENVVRVGEANFASVGLLTKVISKSTDLVFAEAERGSMRMRVTGEERLLQVASWEEYDDYVREYLGHADAIIAVARMHDQAIAFFWEYLLPHLGGLKPLSSEEQTLYEQNGGGTELSRLSREFDEYARVRVRDFLRGRHVELLDPLPRLRTHRDTVFIDYGHYTKEGNAFMARFIYETMRATFVDRGQRLSKGS